MSSNTFNLMLHVETQSLFSFGVIWLVLNTFARICPRIPFTKTQDSRGVCQLLIIRISLQLIMVFFLWFTTILAVFGCIKCLRGFRDETSLLEHYLKSANGVGSPKPISDDEFYCHWFDCNQSFSSYGRLHAHVIANHNKKNFVPFCFWRHCENKWPLWSGTEVMERHLLLHVFVETCLRRTKRTLLKRKDKQILVCRGIEFQKTSSLYRVASLLLWQSNVLNNGFICRWHDCSFR